MPSHTVVQDQADVVVVVRDQAGVVVVVQDQVDVVVVVQDQSEVVAVVQDQAEAVAVVQDAAYVGVCASLTSDDTSPLASSQATTHSRNKLRLTCQLMS